MTVPSQFWELPVVAVVLVIVLAATGWFIVYQAKAMDRQRVKFDEFISDLVDQAKLERVENVETLTRLTDQSRMTAETSIAAQRELCQAVTDHDKRMAALLDRHDKAAQTRIEAVLAVTRRTERLITGDPTSSTRAGGKRGSPRRDVDEGG